MSQQDARDVLKKLKAFESMTWHEMEGGENHLIPAPNLIAEAQKRLEEIQKDDVEEVFSLRINARQRVIGIRRGATLYFLWWDPLHEVCPSPKGHT